MSKPALKPIDIYRETCTIQEVIDQLSRIILWAEDQNNALGFFPALYRAVTIRVAEGIQANRFRDGAEMEKLDVVFANRYFEALDLYLRGEQPTKAWDIAFRQWSNKHLIVLQHLLLGINAHINLDLGLSAAKVAQEIGDLNKVEEDFLEINRLLKEMVDEVQQRLNAFSMIWRGVDYMMGKTDELLTNFSLVNARKFAWSLAEKAYEQADPYEPSFVKSRDNQAQLFAKLVLNPPGIFLSAGLKIMGRLSFTEATAIIQELKKPYT